LIRLELVLGALLEFSQTVFAQAQGHETCPSGGGWVKENASGYLHTFTADPAEEIA
jgi:hypothetical protein